MRHGKLAPILAGAVLAGTSGMASAAPQDQAAASGENCWEKSFLTLDANTDGTVSKQEATDLQKRLFDVMDKNDDGAVSRLEYGNCTFGMHTTANVSSRPDDARAQGTPEAFADLDTNRDEAVDYGEYMAAGQAAWKESGVAKGKGLQMKDFRDQMTVFVGDPEKADLDRNRQISEAEAAIEAHRSFAALDRDNDGDLTLMEWQAMPSNRPSDARFDALDSNRDGALSRNEFDQGRNQRIDLAENPGPMTIWTYQWYVPVASVGLEGERMGEGNHYRSAKRSKLQPASIAAGFKVGQLIGREVVGPDGTTVGQVTDVLVDSRGEANHVLVESSQQLGIGGRQYALPIGRIHREGDRLVTEMGTQEITARPGYSAQGEFWVRDPRGEGEPQRDGMKKSRNDG